MTREDKAAAIAELKEDLLDSSFFYIADSSVLPVSKVDKLRRMCFDKGIKMKVAKNTLIRKALENEPESKGYAGLWEALHGPTTILISDNPKAPAKLIQEFRGKDGERPILKAAYIDSSVFLGDDQLKALTELKSREEVIGDILGLLMSPAQQLVSQINATGSKIAGIAKVLSEREEGSY